MQDDTTVQVSDSPDSAAALAAAAAPAEAAAPVEAAVDADHAAAMQVLKNDPFTYSEQAAIAAIKKRGAAAILTARGQMLTLLDEWANVLPFQLTARLEKLIDRHHPAE